MKVKSLNEFSDNSVNEGSDIDGFLDALSAEVTSAGGYFYFQYDFTNGYGLADWLFAVSKRPLLPSQISKMFDSGRPAPSTELFFIDSGSMANVDVKDIANKIKKLGIKVDVNSLSKAYL
jgi:hypothetical protein